MADADDDPNAPCHWIFQADPERYDLKEKLQPGVSEHWLASRYGTRMRPGDVVWLWRFGEQALYGVGNIELPAQRDPIDGRLSVLVRYETRFDEPLPVTAVVRETDLRDLQNLKAPWGTNFPLTRSQALALAALASQHGLKPPFTTAARELEPYVGASTATPLLFLLPRAQVRPIMVPGVVQCADLLASLFSEGAMASFGSNVLPAVSWLHRALTGDDELVAAVRPDPTSLLASFTPDPRFYDPGIDEDSARLAVGRLGEVFSAAAADAFERACLIQASVEDLSEATGQSLPESRPAFDHALIAALLFGGNPGVHSLLGEDRQSLAALRDSFLDQVGRTFGSDSVVRWRRFARPPGAGQALASYATDSPQGADALEIEPDVRAFASVIAARAVRPPLSIGLFGDWGSGKSFFMERLRREIDALRVSAIRAVEGDPGRLEENLDSPFWPNIVQVEFNAWHYVESNLWASLVAHLFNRLAQLEEKAEAERSARHETLIRELNVAAALQRRLQDERRAALGNLRKTELRVNGLRRRREEQRRKLTRLELLRAIPWDRVAELALDKAVVQRARDGDVAALETLRADIAGELEETRRVGERAVRLGGAVRSLGWESAVWMLCAVGLGIVAFLLARPLIEQGTLGAVVAALVAGAAPLLAWYRRLRGKAAEALAILEQARENIARAALPEPSVEERREREKLARIEAMLRHTEEQARQAAERVENASAALTEFRTTASVAHFLEERAASGDYREKLGLLALIRNDFEELSRRLRRARGEAGPAGTAASPLPVTDASRIDRIVLYIDDLDRCPPERVFEVLQAIHLLLAFDLFVVVVGVDERWLSRALILARIGLLTRGGSESLNLLESAGLELGDTASPSDFLEKIFQIPFWLRPVNKQDFGRLVDALVAADLAPEQQRTPVAPTAGGVEAQAPDPDAMETPSAERAEGPEGESIAGAESILIQPFERNCMRDLSSVVGRSPRTAKAFVNIWRVLKARESIDRELVPLRQEESCGGLLLLALVVGHPNGTEAVLEWIRGAGADTPVYQLFESAGQDDQDKRPDTLRDAGVPLPLYKELARMTETHLGDLTADRLQAWLPTVRRFSFDAAVARDPGHLDLFRRAKKPAKPVPPALPEQPAAAAD